MSNNFKEGFEHYSAAISTDIEELELVISLLEQHTADARGGTHCHGDRSHLERCRG